MGKSWGPRGRRRAPGVSVTSGDAQQTGVVGGDALQGRGGFSPAWQGRVGQPAAGCGGRTGGQLLSFSGGCMVVKAGHADLHP
jgi:hypothetical protein